MAARFRALVVTLLVGGLGAGWVQGQDLDEIRSAGVLRHLGIPYANFVTGSGDGLDVELIQGFAQHLIALERWPGSIKVIGPISGDQVMAVGFRKDTPQLRAACNAYLAQRQADGSYNAMVRRFYPAVFHYYSAFFASTTSAGR